MPAAPLDLVGISLGSLKTEVDAGLNTLISGLEVAEKFAGFLNPSLGAELAAAVKILQSIEAVANKVL